MSRIHVIVGGQYGSEAKGAVTAELARRSTVPTAIVRVAGPNAGHTAYDAQGRKWALRQIPAGAVTNLDATLIIAAGSEIDPPVLQAEIEALEAAGIPIRRRLIVDTEATVIEDHHKEAEAALVGKIGSTGKGIGAARADRLLRKATCWGDYPTTFGLRHVANAAEWLSGFITQDSKVLIEGTQGFGLGLHAGHYPQVTSSDCRAIDFLAMAGLSPWQPSVDDIVVWVVVRAYPIRVAGNSGPMKGETTWADLGLEPEKTTVTQKIRRVGEWDAELVHRAIIANGGPGGAVKLAYTMADQQFPELAGKTTLDSGSLGDEIDAALIERLTEFHTPIGYIGTGPSSCIFAYREPGMDSASDWTRP